MLRATRAGVRWGADDAPYPNEAVPVTRTGRRSRRRWWPAGLAWALWASTLLGLALTVWLDRLLLEDGYPELAFLVGGGNFTLGVAALSAATVGAVVASRRPRHPVGWLLVALGLAIAAGAFSFASTRYGRVARPRALPAADYLAGFANGAVFIYLSLAGFVMLLTPTGALPSPRWRRWARIEVAAVAGGGGVAGGAGAAGLPHCPGRRDSDGVVLQAALGVSVAILPLVTGAAILRYRLYDIDRIVSRTLAWALPTVVRPKTG